MEPTTYTDAICGETLTEGIDDILIVTISLAKGTLQNRGCGCVGTA